LSFWKYDRRRKLDGRYGRFEVRCWQSFSRLDGAGNGSCFYHGHGNVCREGDRRLDFRGRWRRREFDRSARRRRNLGRRGWRLRPGLDLRREFLQQ
jgi:hypothetical protein